MKMIAVLAFVAVFAPSRAYGQTAVDTSVYWMYAELLGTQKIFSPKVVVEVDFGQAVTAVYWGNRIVDLSTGKARSFNSMVDAMNFMGNDDWEFVQAYIITEPSRQNVYHWLLKRACRKDETGAFLPMTKADWKAKQNAKTH